MNQIEELELKIAKFLRVGVIIAGILMFIGWMSQIKMHGDPFFNFQVYDQISIIDLVQFHIRKQNWGILISYCGLITLISLPLIRVMLTALLFVKQKEFILAGIASIVLIGLISSMLLGIDI